MDCRISIPVKMDGAHNFRDLGGYPASGGMTRRGCFFRSDSLAGLSGADRSWMRQMGITCVLDLRSRKEIEQAPDSLDDSFLYYPVCMSDRMTGAADLKQFPKRLSELYIEILNSYQQEMLQVMQVLVERAGKPAVFHCTAGKDRTGVTAMLLLSLAGVPEELIIRDYASSAENMAPVFQQQKLMLEKAGWKVPEALFSSPAEEMELAMEYLKATWGDTEQYLISCGASRTDLMQLKALLVEK